MCYRGWQYWQDSTSSNSLPPHPPGISFHLVWIMLLCLRPWRPAATESWLEPALPPCPHLPNIYPLKVNIILYASTWKRPLPAQQSPPSCTVHSVNSLAPWWLIWSKLPLNLARHFKEEEKSLWVIPKLTLTSGSFLFPSYISFALQTSQYKSNGECVFLLKELF